MQYIEFTGKTVDEAVEKGLQELGLTKETAEIVVLEEGKKKLFSSVKARVQIAPKTTENEQETCVEPCESEDNASDCACCKTAEKGGEMTDGERAVVFLKGLFSLLNVSATPELVSEGEKVQINVQASNTNAIIGKRGATLDAIQTLAGAVANMGRDDYKRVVVDCENYRETRETTLNKLAENLAQKAIRLERKIKLEPMNPYERRIIHATLSEREGVSTQSEGKEPNRYIVVIPDNLSDPDAPALEAGNNRGGQRRDRSNSRNRQSGKGGYNKKPFNRDKKRAPMGNGSASTGGTTLKKSSDFFGIFLGNSGSDDKE